MKETDIKLIAIDLDGTLLTDDKRISETNFLAIREAMKAGVKVCIATGRAWPGAKEFVREIGTDVPVVTSNGAMIVSPADESVLYDCQLTPKAAREIYALGETREDITQIVWSSCRLFVSRMDELAADYAARFGKMTPKPVPSIEELCEQGVSKILWYWKDNDSERYREEMAAQFAVRGVTVVTSTPYFLEFFHEGLSKGEAVKSVAERYGIPMSRVMALGDAGNDTPLIKEAGIGVAVGNATGDVKQAADYVSADNEHDGVAEAIRRFVLRK